MTREAVTQAVLKALTSVAPEADPASIDPNISLRDQLDIDSMDVVMIVIAIHQDLGVDIPEVDYPKLATLNGCVDYLLERVTTEG